MDLSSIAHLPGGVVAIEAGSPRQSKSPEVTLGDTQAPVLETTTRPTLKGARRQSTPSTKPPSAISAGNSVKRVSHPPRRARKFFSSPVVDQEANSLLHATSPTPFPSPPLTPEVPVQGGDRVVKCLCGCTDDRAPMRQCPTCQTLQHGDCEAVHPEMVPSDYHCHGCRPDLYFTLQARRDSNPASKTPPSSLFIRRTVKAPPKQPQSFLFKASTLTSGFHQVADFAGGPTHSAHKPSHFLGQRLMKRDSDTAPDERSEKRSKASVNFNGSSFNSSSASLSPATSTSSRIVDATQLSFAARVAKSAPELLPLVIGQEYYKCSNANSPDAFECEHCGGLQHLMWASGPSGRKLLCKTCANMWTLAPLPKLSAMEDNVSSGQRTPTTPEHESGTLPAVSLNAPTPPRWGESLVIRPFVPTSAVLQPRARQIYPKKPAPPNIKVFQSQAEQGKPLLAFLAALAPGLTAAAPLLGKLGIDCKEDLERLHPAWWPDFFDQEIHGRGLSALDEIVLKSRVQVYLDRLPC